jgi:hypothetical protein
VDVAQAGIITWFKPTILDLRYQFLRYLQKLYDDFVYYILKELLWGHKWYDQLLSLVGYVASIASFGAAAAGIQGGRAALLIAKLGRIFGRFKKFGKLA